MNLKHLQTTEPLRNLPDSWEGLKICLKFVGGVGDVVMALGGSVRALKKRRCHVTAAALGYQLSLLSEMGFDACLNANQLNQPQVRHQFNVVIDFAGSLNHKHQLKAGCYYELISARLGVPIGPGQFSFERGEQLFQGREAVFLHPGASNPNRRWSDEKWLELAYRFAEYGKQVFWLGTRDEFGFSDRWSDADYRPQICKLSDQSEDLLWQTAKLARFGRFFVGNDSGFCHIAGVLGISGVVLFTVTESGDVIGRYPTLTGVDIFDALSGLMPTRSLHVDDPIGRACSEGLSVDHVWTKVARFCATDCTELVRTPVSPRRTRLGVVGVVSTEQVSFLQKLGPFFDVVLLTVEQCVPGDIDAVLRVTKDRVQLSVKDRCVTLLSLEVESFRRAVREVLRYD